MPEIIFDSCVLSNFALVDGIGVLRRLYAGKSYITDFVRFEIMKGIHSRHEKLFEINVALKDGWLQETVLKKKKEKEFFEGLSTSLGAGESSCIAVAKARGYVFASDDRKARREAGFVTVAFTGTVGILLRAVKKNLITAKEGDNLLKKMAGTGFFSPATSLKKIIR